MFKSGSRKGLWPVTLSTAYLFENALYCKRKSLDGKNKHLN